MTEKQAAQGKNDWLLKVLAVVCAIVLWFYADAESNPFVTKHFDVPVQYVNQADNLAVEGGVQTVRITIRGKEADTYSLRSDDFTAEVDLSAAVVGSGEYAVQVQAPSLVERFSVAPDKVTLHIDEVQSKEVPVRVRTTGTVPAGYELESTEVLPGTVIITGLSKDLEAVSDIETEAIDLSKLTAESTLEVNLHTDDKVSIQGVGQVAVHFLIQEKQNHSSYTADIALYHVPDGYTVTLGQQSATVILSGSNALLESQRELSRIQFYVDCSGLSEGDYELPVQVNYSGDLTIGQLTPAAVQVTVTAAEKSVFDDNAIENHMDNETTNQDEGEIN